MILMIVMFITFVMFIMITITRRTSAKRLLGKPHSGTFSGPGVHWCWCWCWCWCRFGSWGLVIKLNFCSDFEHKVWSRFWSWSSGKIWSWSLVSILLLMFCRGNEVESWSRFWSQVWSISWILSLLEILMFADVEILKLVLGQYSEDERSWCLWSRWSN